MSQTEREYYLNLYHRNARVVIDKDGNPEPSKVLTPGHFYVGLVDGNGKEKMIGKYPKDEESTINSVIGQSKIKDELVTHMLLTKLEKTPGEYITSKTIRLTEEQYNAAVRYVESNQDGSKSTPFVFNLFDCSVFVQGVYNAAGLSLHFTMLHTKEELLGLNTPVAMNVLKNLGSRDTLKQHFSNIEGVNKQQLAQSLNLSPDKVKPILSSEKVFQPSDATLANFEVTVEEDVISGMAKLVGGKTVEGDSTRVKVSNFIEDASLFNQLVRECNAILQKCAEFAEKAFKSFVQHQKEALKNSGEDSIVKSKAEAEAAYADYVKKDVAKFSELTATVKAESETKFAEAKAQVAAANAANRNLAIPSGGGTVTVDNNDIVAKYQSIYSQFNTQYKSEYEKEVSSINAKYQELARQNDENIAKLISTQKESLNTKVGSFANGIHEMVDEIKRKVEAGEAVDMAGEKKQILQNAKQFLEGVNKDLGTTENVDITQLIGLDGEGLKEAA